MAESSACFMGWPARFLGCEAGGVVRFHAASLFFCLFGVITNGNELFATLRRGV
jgi:hypothetical protein